ncbi:MAG: alpha/beta fold hydrolase [Acetobacteraceae bacterium]|nr:alpha/beta fold hydrolase [Acetobacteraceae bacterium]
MLRGRADAATGMEVGVGGLWRWAGTALLLLATMMGAAVAQSGSRPTGTQGVQGNPNCPPPVIGGVIPRNWSCPTGTQRVLPRGDTAQPPVAARCVPREGAPYRLLVDMHDMAVLVFDNYGAGRQPIFIARISNMTNPQSYLVALSGTQVVLDRLQQTTGLGEDILASVNLRDSYSRSVIRALRGYDGGRGVPAGAQLVLVGHSLGGMVAQNLAASAEFNRRWRPQVVVTLGSPRTVALPIGLARRFAAVHDIVTTLSPAAWGLGGFDRRNQVWVDNGVPASEALNPIAPHLHYPDSQDLYDYDALGVPRGRGGNVLTLDAAGQEYCPSQVL